MSVRVSIIVTVALFIEDQPTDGAMHCAIDVFPRRLLG
jgi:hypothetical protein